MAGLSARNPAVQRLRRLVRQRRARDEEHAYVIDGPTLIAEALASGVELDCAFADRSGAIGVEADNEGADDTHGGGQRKLAALVHRLDRAGVQVHDVGAAVLAGALDLVTPQGIAAIAHRRRCSLEAVSVGPSALVLILAGVADPGNAGTMLRSAEASGVTAVIATEGSVDLFAPKAVRASAGALFRVPVVVGEPGPGVVRVLQGSAVRVFGTTARGATPYDRADLAGACAIVVGNEAHGIPGEVDELVDERLTIPMYGPTESLNVAMAATLLCFEAARQRRPARGADG
jgi:TrmH family RNA methyltransferase